MTRISIGLACLALSSSLAAQETVEVVMSTSEGDIGIELYTQAQIGE